MTDLTQDELTVLLIAAEGQPMAPIGRWEEPIKALVAKGFLMPHRHPGDPTGHFNNYITVAGRAAAEAAENANLRAMIGASNKIANATDKARGKAERIAVSIVELVDLTNEVTGEDKRAALDRWTQIITARAMELLR
jgi:hypothetical protein